jgi:Icc-related predicted phosphoesterase
MRVLTISDEVVPVVYSLQIKERFADVQLVFACGDLPYYYLEYCVSMLNTPLLYVAGNHDKDEWTGGGELLTHPRGCSSVEDRIVTTHGLTIAGLGGSMRYNNESGAQYSETEMMLRVVRLAARMRIHTAMTGKRLDVMLSHAPLAGIHDAADRPHRGSHAFVRFQRWFTPTYWIHGHVHRNYSYGVATETYYNSTRIINTAGYRHMTLERPRHTGTAHA